MTKVNSWNAIKNERRRSECFKLQIIFFNTRQTIPRFCIKKESRKDKISTILTVKSPPLKKRKNCKQTSFCFLSVTNCISLLSRLHTCIHAHVCVFVPVWMRFCAWLNCETKFVFYIFSSFFFYVKENLFLGPVSDDIVWMLVIDSFHYIFRNFISGVISTYSFSRI